MQAWNGIPSSNVEGHWANFQEGSSLTLTAYQLLIHLYMCIHAFLPLHMEFLQEMILSNLRL